MPFVKGMLHEVDFRDFLKSAGCSTVTDIFGTPHPIDEVEIILTKSMFKGYGWLTDNGLTWEDYLTAFRKYDHALYVTGTNKPSAEGFTELNYQFLNTLASGRIPSFRSPRQLGSQPFGRHPELDHQGNRTAVLRSHSRP